MGRPKLSQYFPPTFKPCHIGVYQTRQNKYDKFKKFQYWDGEHWGYAGATADIAFKLKGTISVKQGLNSYWFRGRALKP